MSLRYIFHLSDLHIRNGDKIQSRYDEYEFVFTNTIISITDKIDKLQLTINEYLIILTGDIFHNKSVIGTYGLLLYRSFIERLTKIGKVIVIQGNHDFQQNEINQPSLVYSSSFDIKNLTILENSTSLIITDDKNNKIGISYVSVNETLDNYKTSGRIQELPEFPKIIGDDIKYKIGLFHGTFAQVKLYNGDEIRQDTNPYPLEWIKEFDFMLLGDIHKRQIFNYKNTICGYSGSLIQQNYGEDILDHGYLLWDLQNKKAKEINVYSNIGYINIKENENEEILIRQNGKYENKLEDIIKSNFDNFPKKLEIKIFSKINFHNLNSLLKNYNILFSIISKIDDKFILTDENETITTDIYNVNELITINNNDYILSYFKKLLTTDKFNLLDSIIKDKQKLLFDVSSYPEDLLNECMKKNKEILIDIESCNNCDEVKYNKSSFIIRYLEWEGLLCYEDKNWLNMSELDTKTFLIKGCNGTGKSAIYDILLLAIWGKNTKQDSLSGGMINTNKEKGYTTIDIEIDNCIYRISRSFEKRKGISNTLNNYTTSLYKFVEDDILEIYKKDTSCNIEIEKLFGTYDNFLFSSMITQNLDNDILKVSQSKCCELIDKYSNVEYLSNLNRLFKTAINKYKDFKRTIENKKQVYEKLLSTNKIEEINEDEIIKTTEEILTLTNKRDKLLSRFNEIPFDIKNPKTLIILNTDYDKLIKSLEYKIITEDEYLKLLDKYNELKYLLKDIDEKEIKKLIDSYTENLEIKLKDTIIINKPCDISLLNDEEKFLKSYLNDYKDVEKEIDLNKLELSIKKLQENKIKYEKDKNELIIIKPEKVDECLIIKDECIDKINKLYETIEDFYSFIGCHNKQLLSGCISEVITYNEYNINVKKIKELNELVELNNKKLLKLDNDFKLCFKKQQDIETIIKPVISITYKTTTTIKRAINTIKIKEIEEKLKYEEQQINEYFKLEEQKTDLEKELLFYNQELLLLNTNDEYKYNPKCEYCCKRPWVCRIKEIEILKEKYEKEIKLLNNKIDENNYLLIIEENENNKKLKDKYYLLNDWYNYYKNKELKDKITKELNEIVVSKDKITLVLITLENEIKEINIKNNHFNIKSFELYDLWVNIDKWNNWNNWNINYNELVKKINDISGEIIKYEQEYNYNINIKPRIKKYYQLKDLYNEWESINKIQMIVRAYQLSNYKNLIDTYDKYVEYNKNELSKVMINEKIKLNDKIKDYEKQIKTLNDNNIKKTTLNGYNKENKDYYMQLCNIYDDIEIMIDTLETIITNFIAFKIELYDKYILNKLTDRTNLIIKSLCHKDTKPFKLDYYISVSKDIIHINWLIRNDNMNDKKLTSISQASGFQHFAISLALRMSLFSNKNEILCNQLFIDEGFVNFDKYNLSIVPNFLKSLLSYFNSIIIVSHIDLIQDNIDEIVEIKYDKYTSISFMNYNALKKTITKKTKK